MSHMRDKDIEERNRSLRLTNVPLHGKTITLEGEEYDNVIYAIACALNRVRMLIREPDVSGIVSGMYLGQLRRREKSLLGIKQRLQQTEAKRVSGGRHE
jgi:hypothetical protein